MSAALHLAGPANRDVLIRLIAAYLEETGKPQIPEEIANALDPLLEGAPHGCAYLLGPVRAPLGFVVLSFGWSVQLGGLQAVLDAVYVRPSIRGRGIATEAMIALPKALSGAGLTALHATPGPENEQARRILGRLGFHTQDAQPMIKTL